MECGSVLDHAQSTVDTAPRTSTDREEAMLFIEHHARFQDAALRVAKYVHRHPYAKWQKQVDADMKKKRQYLAQFADRSSLEDSEETEATENNQPVA